MQSVVGNEALFAKAGLSANLDIQGHLRQDLPAGQTFQMTLNIIEAGTDANVTMRASVIDDQTITENGIAVDVPSEQGFGNETVAASYHSFFTFFRPDNGEPPGITNVRLPSRVFSVDPAGGPIDSTYKYGLVEAGGNIILDAYDPTPTAPKVNVLGTTDTLTTGHIDG